MFTIIYFGFISLAAVETVCISAKLSSIYGPGPEKSLWDLIITCLVSVFTSPPQLPCYV